MKKFGLVLLAGLMLILTGCPYTSVVPLDEPAIKYDKDLLGEWKKPSNEDDYYVVKEFDEYRFVVTTNEKNSDGGFDTKDYNCFLSNVGGVLFLNMKEVGAEEYSFYKYEFDGENYVKLYPVTEYITEKFEKSADLKKFFNKNKKLSFFYEGPDEYEKKW